MDKIFDYKTTQIPKTISYTDKSNSNRFTYYFYNSDEIIKAYILKNEKRACHGDIISAIYKNNFNSAEVTLFSSNYINKSMKLSNSNNCYWLPKKLVIFYLNYVKSVYPIFDWSITKNNSDIEIDLFFKKEDNSYFTILDKFYMKVILNLVRKICENPRNAQIKLAIELFYKKWHNLDLYQLILLLELTEFLSTNDHKLLSYNISILPSKDEILNYINTTINSDTLLYEVHDLNIGSHYLLMNYLNKYESLYFPNYPTTLTKPFLDYLEHILTLVNKVRKNNNLHEL